MNSLFVFLSLCLILDASAQSVRHTSVHASEIITGTTSIATGDLVELLQLTVLKCQFLLPKKTEPGQGYGLEYWVEDWRKDADSPTLFEEGYLGLGGGGTSHLLVKFPDGDSLKYYFSTSENTNSGKTKLKFEDMGSTSWHLLSKTNLEIGKPILIALRIDGGPPSSLFPANDAALPDVFAFYRKHESIQIVAFYNRIKEAP